jgi:hypothetical protein
MKSVDTTEAQARLDEILEEAQGRRADPLAILHSRF